MKRLRTLKHLDHEDASHKHMKVDPIAETLCHPRFIPIKQTGNLGRLPYELLVEIAKRLKKLEDFTCFRCVSRSLHLAVEMEYFEGLRIRKSLPYLMLRPVADRDGIRRFYSLVEGESVVASLGVPTFETMTKMCLEALGWLLTVGINGIMSLLDPFSNTEIPVPHLNTFPGLWQHPQLSRRSLITKMVLSSRPNETSDFILMVIIGDCSYLAFWRLGDGAWNKIHEPKLRFNDVVYAGGEQFYAINSHGTIWAINLAAGRVESRIIIDHVPGLLVGLFQGQYILKSIDGSLLGITRIRDKKSFLTIVFRVYGIDVETGKWKEIHSLGCMAIFVGRNSSIAVDATAPSNGGVIRANHIYFTDDYGDYINAYTSDGRRVFGGGENSRFAKSMNVDSAVFDVDIGVFDFETGGIEAVYPVEPWSDVCPAMWITPNLSFHIRSSRKGRRRSHRR